MKELIHQEDLSILNVYVPNSRATKYVNQKLKNKRWNREKLRIIIVAEFKTPLSAIDKTTKSQLLQESVRI